jgi:hypothetical protein
MRLFGLAAVFAGITSFTFAADVGQPVIDYSKLVDGSAVTHTGRTVAEELEKLRSPVYSRVLNSSRDEIDLEVGRMISSHEAPRSRSKASTELFKLKQHFVEQKSLVQPFLQPVSFALEDLLEASDPAQMRANLIEVATLFPEGSPQPAWADLLRTRYYYVLSNGSGYARFFVPGGDAATAWKHHVPALRHVVQFLLASSKPVGKLDVDIYAYENNLVTQKLKLAMPKLSLSFTREPDSGLPESVDLAGLQEFLSKGWTIEGAGLDEKGKLVLLGTPNTRYPTLEGQAVSLADLAVAYRAVFYAGEGSAYMSLDRSEYPEQSKVNFGGRLKDTRLGWVALRADLRFKTISDGFDPVTGEDLQASLAKKIGGFFTQQIRQFALPKDQWPEVESTRFWFYPDDITVEQSADGKRMKIRSPRYTAAAERQFEDGGDDKAHTPPWTKDSIAHLNVHYDAYADVFPEIRELDTEGRLLALFTWLHQKQLQGALQVDIDGLLNVELPRCQTPSYLPQLLVVYAQAANNSGVRVKNVSDLAERYAAERREGGREIQKFDRERRLSGTPGDELLLERAGDLAVDRFLSDNPGLAKSADEFEQNFDISGAITGGLDLAPDPTRTIRSAGPELDGTLARVMHAAPGHGILDGGKTWFRSPESGRPIDDRATPRLHRIVLDNADSPGIHEASASGIKVSEEVSATGKAAWIRSIAPSSADDGQARFVHYEANGKLADIVRLEAGRTLEYGIEGSHGEYIASPRKAGTPVDVRSFAAIDEAVRTGRTSGEVWARIPADSGVLGADRAADGRVAILYKREGQPALRYTSAGAQSVEVRGSRALDDFENIGRERVRAASNARLKFVFAMGLESDEVRLQVGDKQVRIDADDLAMLLDNPRAKEPSPLEGAFAPGGEYVIYRDSLDRRPSLNGGSVRENTPTNPVRLAEMLQSRYADSHFYLDDEPEMAVRNHAALAGIRGPEDLVAMIPEETFAVQDWDLRKRIKGYLEDGHIKPVDTGAGLNDVPNVLMVSGDNEPALAKYLTELGEKGFLKDRVLLLNTCYARQNPNFFSELLAKYQPKAIFLHGDYVHVDALQRMVRELGPMLNEARASDRPIAPADLLRNAVNRALADPSLSPRLRLHLEMLNKGVLQISQALTDGRNVRHG